MDKFRSRLIKSQFQKENTLQNKAMKLYGRLSQRTIHLRRGSSLHFCHHFNILILVNLSDLAVIYRHNQIFTNMFALIILIFFSPLHTHKCSDTVMQS